MLKDMENKKLSKEQTNEVVGGCPLIEPKPEFMTPPKDPEPIDMPLPEDPDPVKAPSLSSSVRKIL